MSPKGATSSSTGQASNASAALRR